MTGLSAAVYCCFKLSLCLAGPIIRGQAFKFICSAENYANVFYSTFTNFFYFCHVFNVLYFSGNVFLCQVIYWRSVPSSPELELTPGYSGVARIWCKEGENYTVSCIMIPNNILNMVHMAATELQQLMAQNTSMFGDVTAQSRCQTLCNSKVK